MSGAGEIFRGMATPQKQAARGTTAGVLKAVPQGKGKGGAAKSPFEEQLGLLAHPGLAGNAQAPSQLQLMVAKAAANVRGSGGAGPRDAADAMKLGEAVGASGSSAASAFSSSSSGSAKGLGKDGAVAIGAAAKRRDSREATRSGASGEEAVREELERSATKDSFHAREADASADARRGAGATVLPTPDHQTTGARSVDAPRELPPLQAPLPVLPPELTDGAVWAVLMPRSAHLSVESEGSRLSLRLRLNDQTAELSVSGVQASAVVAHENELRVALAHEGLSLGQLSTGEHGRDQSRERPEAIVPVVPVADANKKAAAADEAAGAHATPRVRDLTTGRVHVEA